MGTTTMLLPLAWFSPWELLILAGLGVVIFGKRLPEVGKNIGRTIVEFKKGLNAPADDVKKAIDDAGQPQDAQITARTTRPPIKQIAANTDEP